MDLAATQVLRDDDEIEKNKRDDELQVGVLKIGSTLHAIRKGFNKIGRSPICQIVLDDVTVSKVHAEIQAGLETAFVSDQRSSNGTKIKDVPIKPFYYYSINHGDVIYFGQVKAVYTTVKTTEPDDFLVPDTPVSTKNRNGQDQSSTAIGNISESYLDNSSMSESEISMIPATQETQRKHESFRKPSTLSDSKQKLFSSTTKGKSPSISKPNGGAQTSDLHEMETQIDCDLSFRAPPPKRGRLQRPCQNADMESNIHDLETQRMSSPRARRRELGQQQAEDDIFDAETQPMSPKASNKKQEQQSDDEDAIFNAETQAISPKAPNNKQEQQSDDEDEIFTAETQRMFVPASNKKQPQRSEDRDDIFEADTQAMETFDVNSKQPTRRENRTIIFDAETQQMEMTLPKSREYHRKSPLKNIEDAETQIEPMPLEAEQMTEESKRSDVEEDISELQTQILPRPTANEDKKSTSGLGRSFLNDTAESSIRSNSSRDRLRLSATPQSSSEEEFQESQDLLANADAQLFTHVKKNTNIPANESRKSGFNENQTIPESSDSESENEKILPRSAKKLTKNSSTKPSVVIQDSSDDETDAENEFAGFLERNGNAKSEEVAAKNIHATPTKGQLEVKKTRSSPLRLRRSPLRKSLQTDVSAEKTQEEAPVKGRTGVSILGGEVPPLKNECEASVKGQSGSHEFGESSSNLSRMNDADFSTNNQGEASCSNVIGSGRKSNEASPKKTNETSPRDQTAIDKLDASPTSRPHHDKVLPKENNEARTKGQNLTSKFGSSPLRLLRKRDEDVSKISKPEQAKSNIFRDSLNKDDTLPKNQTKPNASDSVRPSLRLPRKNDDISPKKIDEKPEKLQGKSNTRSDSPAKDDLSDKIRSKESAKEQEEENISDAETQRMNDDVVDNTASARENNIQQKNVDTGDDDEMDIDLLPTQILHVPSSTPFSRRSKNRQKAAELHLDGDDLDCAPTQIFNVDESPRIENYNSTDAGKIIEKQGKEKDNKTDENDLNDSLAINLGNLLGEEANNDHFADDDTQLMTQNLVDILKPTQSFTEAETGNRRSSPRSAKNIAQGSSSSPMRKKIYVPGTLGFVDGEARDSSKELVSADSSPNKLPTNEKQNEAQTTKADEPGTSAYLDDEDDIFSGLPEVKISGTLSNPGSPASSSSSSSDNDFLRSVQSSSRSTGKRGRKSSTKSGSTSNTRSVGKSRSPPGGDSPITPNKSRITRREVSRYRIVDSLEDSEDDFDYQDLKRMADRLLATNSLSNAKCLPKSCMDFNDESEKLPVPARQRANVRKPVATKKAASSNKRAGKLPCVPSSLTVSGVRSESSVDEASGVKSAESSVDSKKSTRKRKATKSAAPPSKVAKKEPPKQLQQSGEESQEVAEILASTPDETRPMISRKSYAKVQLTRLDAKKEESVVERPKVTRGRRTTSAIKTETSPSVASPAKSRGRRTVGEAPGIPGTNEEDHKILFTGVKDDDYYKIVTKLGGTVVSDPSKATVLITDKVRRTFKFLCAVAQGIRVVSINWLLESNKASRFLNCDNFILKEPAAEAKYKFSLAKSLQTARTKKLLEGYTIIVTPKVNQPEVHELKGMVEACGGRLLVRPGRSWDAKTVIISREEDFAVAQSYLAKAPKKWKITVHSTEFILTGILRQEINLVEHKLNFG